MSDIQNLIEINEAKLKNFEEKLKCNITPSEREIIYINIKNVQEFIISLYKLKSKNINKNLNNKKEQSQQSVDNQSNNIEISTNNIIKEDTTKKEIKRLKNKSLKKRKAKSVKNIKKR